jgi:hypothetical protein
MGLFTYVAAGTKARLLADLSSQVALRSRDTVWTLVRERVVALRSAEARGYARARARECVERQAELVFQVSPPPTSELRTQIIDAALEQVAAMVMRELASSPARAAAVRRAA